VRSPEERKIKRIENSLHVPLNHLLERLLELPRGKRLVVHCASGYRSSIGASLLRRHGIPNVADLAGGISAWEASGLPVSGQPEETVPRSALDIPDVRPSALKGR
jgi:hydroxyacylglutathione hydrolase